MRTTVIEVTEATFQAEVLRSPRPVLVELWAERRPPCKLIGAMPKRAILAELGELLPVA